MNKPLLEKLLNFYNISYDEYLYMTRDVSLDTFQGEHRFDDIDNAVKLVKDAIANKDKIMIYGDYDADGIMGTSILVKMFQYLDVVVDYYIPSRYVDGYGLSLEHTKEYVKNGYNLVITVDNGISAFEPISYLKDNGVKVLVLDHHQVQEDVPNADAICHPTYSHFGETASSGAFTAFIFSIAVLGYIDRYLSILGSISLISDMMPLKDYNRDLLRAVFKTYKPREFLPIDLLADGEVLDETVIGMKIAPRINSIGRLCEDTSINDIVLFFTSSNKDFILNYFSYIVEMNETRKILSKESPDISFDNESPSAIVILGDYKEGLIGLMANAIVSKYHVPTVVFTKSLNGEYKGSARAPEGFNLVEAFNKLTDLLITFGGHASAGGCSLTSENYEAFKSSFHVLAKNTPIVYVEHPSIEINFSEINLENYELVKSFSPFGEAWKVPTFKIKHIKTDSLMYSRDSKHILTTIGSSLRLVGFGFSREEVSEYNFINVIGYLEKSSFRGNVYIEFKIKEIEPYKN